MAKSTHTSAQYPYFENEARHAARLWLQWKAPALSLCDFRDNRFNALTAGEFFHDYAYRKEAFNNAFAGEIGLFIAGGEHE